MVPPDTVTSLVSKPVTASEKVNVTLSGVTELILAGSPPIVRAGASKSKRAWAETAEEGPVSPHPTVTVLGFTITVTPELTLITSL